MLKNGYIFAHRSLLDWGWYKDVPTCKLWLHLLLCANYEPCEFMGEKIAAGEFATSYVSLADGSGLTVKQVRNALDKLKKTGEISVRTNRHYSVIAISKYDEYQRQLFANRADRGQTETVAPQGFPGIEEENWANKGQTEGRPRADLGQTDGTQRATMEEYNKAIKQKGKNILPPLPPQRGDCAEPGTASTPPVIVLPLNTGEYGVPQEQVDEWAGLYPAVDVMQQLRNMKGWLDSNPSRRKTKAGVKRFITGWLSKEQDKGGRKPTGARQDFQPTEDRIKKNNDWLDEFLKSQEGK